MATNLDALDPYLKDKLLTVLEQCDRRRRFHCWTRMAAGAALLTAFFTLILAVFDPNTIWYASGVLAFACSLAYLFWRQVHRPLRQPIRAEQVALYIDEHYPELQNRMISLVSLADGDASPSLTHVVERFLQESRDFIRHSSLAYTVHFRWPEKRGWLIAAFVFAALWIPWQFSGIWAPALKLGSLDWWAPALEFSVSPGNARVRAGEDQVVLVKSRITDRPVAIHWRAGNGSWQAEPMKLGDSDQVHYYSFHAIQEPIVYRVRFGSQHSPEYELTPWVPPEVTAIDLTYYYPDYLDFPPRQVPNGGDIVALQGSTIELRAHVNKAMRSVNMVFDSGRELAFQRKREGLWVTSFEARENDRYHIQPVDRDGRGAGYHPTYEITVETDRSPVVKIEFPNRDVAVSALEEVPFHFKVDDDYGLTEYGLRYQVTGQEPVSVPLNPTETTTLSAHASHQLLLEGLSLEPGDLVSWTVWAKDRKPDRRDYEILSDPFFLEIRPFQQRFRQAVSAGGSMRPGGGGGSDLITLQKDVLIATWNLRRSAPDMEDAAFGVNRQTIYDAQVEIQKAAAKMARESREPLADELNQVLKSAVTALDRAIMPDPVPLLSQAATHQQRAYSLLLKLEPELTRVSQSQNMGGGTGAQRRMAGLDALEMKRNRNFYEEERGTRQEQETTERVLDKIKELARRQKMINDEIAKLISELEREEENAALQRRLERLREEAKKNLEQLDGIQRELTDMEPQRARQARDQLDRVRESLNRGFRHLEEEQLQEARSEGSRALDDLDRMEQDLKNRARGSASERMQALQEKLDELRRQENAIRDSVAALRDREDAPRLDEKDPVHRSKNEIMEEKKHLAEKFKNLMEDAADLANLTRESQELLSRELGDWLRKTSKKGIVEDIEETQELLRYGAWEGLDEKENRIADKLSQARDDLESVAGVLVDDDLEARDKALQTLAHLLEQAGNADEPWDEERLRNFAETESRQWLQRLRNTEALLPPGGPLRRELGMLRRQIEKIRRDYRRKHLVPRFELVLDNVLNPLTAAAEKLGREIERLRGEREFVLEDDSAVPERYRKRVSQYFQALSESETERNP